MSNVDCSLKSLTSPAAGELLQSHNSLTFKLLKTVADFSQALATLHDRFGHELQMLVETFRKRNGELRKERLNCPNSLFQIWELFLQQVEVNSQQYGDISRDLSQTIGQGLIERVFHRKIQSKKVFAHRDRIEAILLKSNELLGNCYKDYCQAYAMALTDPAQYLSEYIASHNIYVHQLQATNGMVHAYQTKTLPRLLEELEECHLDTSSSISSSLLSSSELITEKSSEQAAGYQNLASACRQANHRSDLAQFVKSIASQTPSKSASELQQDQDRDRADHHHHHQASGGGGQSGSEQAQDKVIRYHQFQGPSLQQSDFGQLEPCSYDSKNLQIVPTFKNEIAPDFSQPPDQQQPKLEKDRESLEETIEKFEERIEALNKLLMRSCESKLHNKVNELQEELCQRKFDLYVAQIHLSAVRSQLQLFEYNFRPISSMMSTNVAAAAAAAAAAADHYHNQAVAGAVNMDSGTTGQYQAEVAGGGPLAPGQVRRSPDNSGVGGPGGASNNNNNSGGGGSGGASNNNNNSSGNSGAGSTSIVAPLGYRHKWIKAFKSLKETPSQQPQQQQQQHYQRFGDMSMASDMSGLSEQQAQQLMAGGGAQSSNQGGGGGASLAAAPENQHFFQEYTFKKIASCDVCKDFLRGHMRQGVKCKLCKISCHNDCQTKAHGTIKCQQPKIKLLRRQKSAGELEVNANMDHHSDQNSDPSERATSSKPDSIYSLIRQVLDAKKRGQHAHAPATPSSSLMAQPPPSDQMLDQHQHQHQHQQHHLLRPGAPFTNSYTMNMNMGMGSLALANQNGKSVSTSALLGPPSGNNSSARADSSVDRWSVVMELLAQSRRNPASGSDATPSTDHDSNRSAAAATASPASDGLQPGGGGGGKRHSKQLDKFKLAARSVGKHQRYQASAQQQQQQSPTATMQANGAGLQPVPITTGNQAPLDTSSSSSSGMTAYTTSGQQLARHQQQQQQRPFNSNQSNQQQQQQQQQQQPTIDVALSHQRQQQPGAPTGGGQQLLLHGTKSLPVGQMASMHQPFHDHQHLIVAPNAATTYDASLASQDHHLNAQTAQITNPARQQQQQAPMAPGRYSNQLLDVTLQQQQQQQQSTSAPHSPQRKRFNLRMKSFSLDSPESPSVGGPEYNTAPIAIASSSTTTVAAASTTTTTGCNNQSQQQQQQRRHQYGRELSDEQLNVQSSSHAKQQQQQQQQQGLISLPQAGGAFNHHHLVDQQQQQQQQQQQSYNLPVPPAGGYYYQSNIGQQQQHGGAATGQATCASATLGHYNQQQQQQQVVSGHAPLASSCSSSGNTGGGASTSARGSTSSQAGARHQQQHRHSYHNQMPNHSSNYHYNAELDCETGGGGATNSSAPLTSGDGRSLFASVLGGGGLIGNGGSGLITSLTASRQCASQGALNIHHTGLVHHQTVAGPGAVGVALGARLNPLSSSSAGTAAASAAGATCQNNSMSHKQQQQQTASGSNNSNSGGAINKSGSSSSSKYQDCRDGHQDCEQNNRAGNQIDYYDLDVDHQQQQQQLQHQQQQQHHHHHHHEHQEQLGAAGGALQQQPGSGGVATNTFVVLYDYIAQRGDEIQLTAGQLVQILDTSERDWWKVCALDGTNRIGYFPASYLAQLYQNERPLQVAQTIQVSNGETCDKLLRGQIVIHTGKQLDNFVTIRTIRPNASPNEPSQGMINFVQCPEKYLLEVIESH